MAAAVAPARGRRMQYARARVRVPPLRICDEAKCDFPVDFPDHVKSRNLEPFVRACASAQLLIVQQCVLIEMVTAAEGCCTGPGYATPLVRVIVFKGFAKTETGAQGW
jgi:hypothetical protein